MMQSGTIGKLAEALAKAQAKVRPAIKGIINPFFDKKYADLAEVSDACRDAMTGEGLSITQGGTFHDGSMFLETPIMHTSGEWQSYELPLRPAKDDPQGMVAAVTYMRRAGLAAIAWVAPEDDDGTAASGKVIAGTREAHQAPPAPGDGMAGALAKLKAEIEVRADEPNTWRGLGVLTKGEKRFVVLRGLLDDIAEKTGKKGKYLVFSVYPNHPQPEPKFSVFSHLRADHPAVWALKHKYVILNCELNGEYLNFESAELDIRGDTAPSQAPMPTDEDIPF